MILMNWKFYWERSAENNFSPISNREAIWIIFLVSFNNISFLDVDTFSYKDNVVAQDLFSIEGVACSTDVIPVFKIIGRKNIFSTYNINRYTYINVSCENIFCPPILFFTICENF